MEWAGFFLAIGIGWAGYCIGLGIADLGDEVKRGLRSVAYAIEPIEEEEDGE